MAFILVIYDGNLIIKINPKPIENQLKTILRITTKRV